jgi:O-antigen/teichoic acid export membrane protein
MSSHISVMNSEIEHHLHRAHRFRRLSSAWITLLPSKGITLLVQLLAVPTIYRAIGPRQFAAYAAVTSAVSIMGFLNLGMGGALVTPFTRAVANRDEREQARLLSSTLVPICIGTGIMLGIAIILLAVLPLRLLFGIASEVAAPEELRAAALVACIGTLVSIPLSVVDNVRQAFQETHVSNLFNTISNVVLCAGLLIVARFHPRLVAFVTIAALSPLAVRLGNLVALVAHRPHLRLIRWRLASRVQIFALSTNGISYLGASAIASVLLYEWPVYYMSRVRPAIESSAFAVQLQLVLLLSAFGVSLLQPLWPAVADAVARRDRLWVRTAVSLSRLASLGYGLLCMFLLGLGMQWILNQWMHRTIPMTRAACWLAGIYVLLVMWEYVHWPLALGIGAMKSASNLVFLRALAFTIATPLAVRFGQPGIMLSLCASILLISAWSYPLLLSRRLKDWLVVPDPAGV